MIKPEIIKEKSIPLVKVEKILKKIEEPNFEQKRVHQHAKEFTKITEKNAEQLEKELVDLDNRKLKESIIIKIIDVLPSTKEDFEVVIQSSKLAFTQEEIKQILEIVKKYVK